MSSIHDRWGSGDGVDTRLLLDAMALSALADDQITEEEEEQLFALAASLPTLQRAAEIDIEDALRAALDRVREDGFQETMERVADTLDADEREEAFMLAAAVQYSDGFVEEMEDDFIVDFGRALGFPHHEIERMLDDIESFAVFGDGGGA